ncbi:MAG: L-threonylcarbamoyladenylate synthase [Methanomassiliicoccales archaeon]|jgi:L-threonylcarbamoyladenylate synthase|nr:L-threonylcarbamoyladenylate synthase [Methanomassiliicoccales archaeon]
MELISCKKKNCPVCDLRESKIREIADGVKQGKLVIYPTETLYGLGANPFDESAIKKVYMVKRRPFDMPLSIAVRDVNMLEEFAVLDNKSRKLISKFTPGPITILLMKKGNIPDILTSATPEIGIRIPDHPLALRLIEQCGPIISTSANLHSRPDPTTAQMAIADIGNEVDYCFDCGPCRVGKPSTIVQVTDNGIEIIRQGAISREAIEAALNE